MNQQQHIAWLEVTVWLTMVLATAMILMATIAVFE
jgi:hypothetical protein